MSLDHTAGKPAKSPKMSLEFLKSNLRDYAMLLALVVIMLFFQVMTSGVLLQPLNLTNLVLQNSYIIIMALGMLLVIVAGHIDLSVGSVVGFVGALAAVMIVDYKIDTTLTVLVCLCVGGLIGAAQGYFVAFFKIPSFIVTLAGMLVFKGLSLYFLNGRSVGPFPSAFQHMSNGFIPDFLNGALPASVELNAASLAIGILTGLALVYANVVQRRQHQKHAYENEPLVVFYVKNVLTIVSIVYLSFLMSSYRGLPNVLVIMAVLITFYTFITTRTTIGRRIYALGGNEKAARLSGIKTERLTFYTFVNMGVLAGLAGMIFAARLNTATPKAGAGFELDVIAACFIGGASASGGVGKVIGAVIGAFVMGVMNNGMSILGVGIDLQQVIKGLVLLAAVFFDVYNKTKS
jgi:putative multiple sugar transport system permease protein